MDGQHVFEVDVEGSWYEVDEDIFRSWLGKRRLDREDYSGPVYYLFSMIEVETA